MKSGAPAFGTPEYMKAQLVGGQLARRYSLPYRTSNTCAANTVDAQAAYESVFSLWGAIQGGANFILHGAGWLEGGLRCSYEKTILDIDLLQMVAEFLTPLDLSRGRARRRRDPRRSAPAAISSARQHTQDRYKTAFYSPIISDWRNFETWAEAGSPTAIEKRQPRLEGAARDLRGALHGPGDPRGAQRLRRQAQGRRRRADGFLSLHRCSRSGPHSVWLLDTSPPRRGEDALAARRSPLPRRGERWRRSETEWGNLDRIAESWNDGATLARRHERKLLWLELKGEARRLALHAPASDRAVLSPTSLSKSTLVVEIDGRQHADSHTTAGATNSSGATATRCFASASQMPQAPTALSARPFSLHSTARLATDVDRRYARSAVMIAAT